MPRHEKISARLTRAVLLLALASLAGGGIARAQAPPASLDDILKQISSYEGGIESAAFWKLRDYVQARKDDPAARAECQAKLLAFLGTRATPVAKMAACKWLRVIADERSVPALQALLLDDRAADMALYVLQQVPGAAVDRALIQTLAKAPGPTKIAIVAALGQRRSADAVPALEPFLGQARVAGGQPDLARAAAFALGSIGGDAGTHALVAAYPTAQADLKLALAGSMMMCAEKSLAARDVAAAERVYDMLAADTSLPVPVRRAAAMGRIFAGGGEAAKILMTYLQGSDIALQEAAIARIDGAIAPDAIAPVCALLPRLPEASQVKLLAVLAGYPPALVLPAIRDAIRANSAPVRIAALKAVQPTGGPAVVPLLTEVAARTSGEEQAAARAALAGLKGRAVDEAIVALMEGRTDQVPVGQGFSPADDGIRGELLLAAGARRIYPAKRAVAASLSSPSPRVRLQALRALRDIGTPSDIDAVLDVLVKAGDDAERAEAEKTTAMLAQKIVNTDRRAGAIRTRLAAHADPAVRAKLIAVLPLVGDDSALPLLRVALTDENSDVSDAAVRAVVAWPTSAARDDVYELARDSRNETHRLLAIQGLVRIIALDRYRDPEAVVADLRQAAGFAWRPEEQKLVLATLAEFPCHGGLELASGFLREPSLKNEAQAAIDKIQARLEAMRKRGT